MAGHPLAAPRAQSVARVVRCRLDALCGQFSDQRLRLGQQFVLCHTPASVSFTADPVVWLARADGHDQRQLDSLQQAVEEIYISPDTDLLDPQRFSEENT